MEKIDESKNTTTVKKETFEIEENLSEVEELRDADLRRHYGYTTWTRVEIDGEMKGWIPHDSYGELPDPYEAERPIERYLEKKYRKRNG